MAKQVGSATRLHQVSRSTVVEAKVDNIFDLLASPAEHSRLDGSDSVQGLIDGPDRLSRGATFQVHMHLFGAPYQITNRVVEFEENRLIAWRHFGPHRWRWELEPLSEERTQVTETFDFRNAGSNAWIYNALGFAHRNAAGIEATLRTLQQAASDGPL